MRDRASQDPRTDVDAEDFDGASLRQLEREQRVAALSRRFLSVSADDFDSALDSAMAEAVEIADCERSALMLSEDGRVEIVTSDSGHHERLRKRLLAAGERANAFRWSARKLARGEVLCVPEVGELPDSARTERDELAALGVRSMLAIPVHVEQRVVGCQVFECVERSRRWTEQEITLLRLVAEILASAIRRRRIESALRESEARFRALTENATELITELDHRGRYLYVSPSARSLLGYECSELASISARKLVHPDDYENSRDLLMHALQSEGESHVIHRVRHRDGSWRWFDNTGRAFRTAAGELRFVSVGRDITDRRRMEQALARQVQLESHIAEASRRFLSATGEEIGDAIRAELEQSTAMFGADRGFLISYLGTRPEDMEVYEWKTSGIREAARNFVPWAGPKVMAGEVLHVPRVDAVPPEASVERQVWTERGIRSLIGVPMLSNDRLIGYLSFECTQAERTWTQQEIRAMRILADLLASALRRKYAEREVSEQQAQLVQSQKIEAVGRLAGGIAHDFNNLLTVILGFGRPLLSDFAEGDPVREDLEQICGAAQRAAALTSQLLAFSRRQSLASQPVDLNTSVGGLEDILRRLLEEDVELNFELAPEACVVHGDPTQIEQILLNLAVNARDAMADGGTLLIRTHLVSLDAASARRRHLAGPGDYAVLRVTDTGCGMDDETLAHVFEPFFTTKDPGKGTGLGLSIAYSVVEQAGGSIDVETKENVGTTISVYLPSVTAETDTSVEAVGEHSQRGSETVLVAEDEAAVRKLVRRILERSGYRVVESTNGEEALAAARGLDVDALVTDVVMPKMGGVELARRLRAERPALPVLYLSGYPDDRGAGDGPQEPGGFLRKPFSGPQLLARLRALIDDAPAER